MESERVNGPGILTHADLLIYTDYITDIDIGINKRIKYLYLL